MDFYAAANYGDGIFHFLEKFASNSLIQMEIREDAHYRFMAIIEHIRVQRTIVLKQINNWN